MNDFTTVVLPNSPQLPALPKPGAKPADAGTEFPGTTHRLRQGDARCLNWIEDESLHLVVTSPPYWTLKTYNDHPNQLGHVADYAHFLDELDRVWGHCYRVLVPGGRLVCVVGDICLARRRNGGRHRVVPLHADIAVRAQRIGFDYLTPILWQKITNVAHESNRGGGGFLGKPYEPNAIVKNDLEYLLMLRKPGGYRQPTAAQRVQSRFTREERAAWFRPVWTDIPGAPSKAHPAPYPVPLAYRLIRMFSFVGDTVLDPFAGTFTTALAALQAGRSSIGVEIDPTYYRYGLERVRDALREGVPGLPQGTLVTESESEEAAGAADVASPSTDAMHTAARYCL